MRPGREADHSPTSCAQVKNAWSYTSTIQYVLVKHTTTLRLPYITRRHNPQELDLNLHGRKNLKSRISYFGV